SGAGTTRGPAVPNRSTPDGSGALISRMAESATPFTFGSKVTVIVRDSSAASGVSNGQLVSLSSPGFARVSVHAGAEKLIGAPLVFVIVILAAAVGPAPLSWAPNLT